MTAGDVALAGDSATVRDVGADLRGRTFGADVGAKLIEASSGLGLQSGNAVSIDRLVAVIQAALAPAGLVQAADLSWGDAAESLGVQMEEIATRTRNERITLADAKATVVMKQEALDSYDASSGEADDYMRSSRGLQRAVDHAEDTVAASEQRLVGLDEERRGIDATASSSIGTVRSEYVSTRKAIPSVPHVSAGVSVSVRMPDGSVQSVSAVDLAKLKDPAAIRAVWDAMTPEQREKLITDFPMLIGNLEGIPLRDRNTANVITAKAHRAELEKNIKMLKLLEKLGTRVDVIDFVADRQAGDLPGIIADMEGEAKSIDAMLGDRNENYTTKKGDDGQDDQVEGQPFGVYLVFDENGRRISQNGTVLVGFNPLRDSYITFQGILDPVTGDVPAWMDQVGVVIPGTTSRLAGFTTDLDKGKNLMFNSGARSGYFTWHGAPMPQYDSSHLNEAAQQGFADVAAARLATFVNSLGIERGTDVVPIGHSYGAAVLGGAEYLGLKADRVVYVAPAGLGHHVDGIEDFPETKDVPHFALQSRNDAIVGWNQGFVLGNIGHGLTNPLTADGVVRLETGYVIAGDPSSGTIESTGGGESHTSVFDPLSTSMRNITRAVKGESVSLYHPDDVEFRGGFAPVMVDVPGSGAAKPEELVSSRTLEEVDG
ncbi:hypothetical protein KZC52_13300 [Microbacterium sp. kSW2-24]|uniref:hypothetical protein n=1 Tax=Microbacterium galbinum TaxID=2851646 RepID=UPI001FFCB4A1|nr:hypothetical protein [Microbacterium galbinum]MCK2023909.1 hypothetical protein [Microbacterium galbinum]